MECNGSGVPGRILNWYEATRAPVTPSESDWLWKLAEVRVTVPTLRQRVVSVTNPLPGLAVTEGLIVSTGLLFFSLKPKAPVVPSLMILEYLS